MKITSLEIWPVKMQLTEPYTIAYETIAAVENIFCASRPAPVFKFMILEGIHHRKY